MSSAATAATPPSASRSASSAAAPTSIELMVLALFRSQGAARKAQALPAALDLSRAASGSEGLLAVLRPGRCRRALVLSFAGAGQHHAGQLRFPRPCCRKPPASRSPPTSTMSASGICASRSPRPIRSAASSSPATPRTRIRPMAAMASTTVSTMSPISAGSSPPRCKAGAATHCSNPTRGAAADLQGNRRGFHRGRHPERRGISGALQPRPRPRRIRARLAGSRRRRGAARHRPTSRITRARRSCSARPAAESSAIGSHTFKARAGHHLPPQPLSSGRNVFEELGDGFTLLAFDADDKSVTAFEAAAKALGAAESRSATAIATAARPMRPNHPGSPGPLHRLDRQRSAGRCCRTARQDRRPHPTAG